MNGQLAAPVNCPVCGAEGTAAANEYITQSLAANPARPATVRVRLNVPKTASTSPAAEPATTPAAAPSLRLGSHIPASAPNASKFGLVDWNQAEIEARAKLSWGDPPEAVLQYLMIQGFPHDEAKALMASMYKERALVVRAKGIKKIVIGIVSMCAGAAGILYMLSIRVVITSLLGIMTGLLLWGLWLIINGTLMVAVPKMQGGDVAEG